MSVSTIANTARQEVKKPFFDDEKIALIKEVAKKSFIELGVIFLMTGITCLFVANPITLAFFVGAALIVFAINVLIRCGIAYARYVANHTEDAELKKNLERILVAAEWIAPLNFAMLEQQTANVVIHEAGHAIAANLLYKTTSTRVEVMPWGAGVTSYTMKGFTDLGSKLGYTATDMIVTAAGTGLAVVASGVAFGVGLGIQDSHPEVSKYLIVSSIINIASHAFYALSALWTSPVNIGHDFVCLALHGIHPIVALIGIVAVPLIIKTGFAINEYIKSDPKPETVTPHLAVAV